MTCGGPAGTRVIGAVVLTAATATGAPSLSTATPIVIAHRGASAYAPEHTFAAWDLALEMGADYLEHDLQMTADGELVLLHDDTLDRTARGPAEHCTGAVNTKTLEQLSHCEVGSWFNDANPHVADDGFAMQRIPTLRGVLERYLGRARFYIETKSPEEAPGMEEKLIALLEEYELLDTTDTGDELPTVILQSFSPESLVKLRALAPGATLIQLTPGRMTSWGVRRRLADIAGYADGIGPHQQRVGPALVGAAHAAGLLVHPYTVNDASKMRSLLALGVDGMFSDRADVLREVIADHPG